MFPGLWKKSAFSWFRGSRRGCSGRLRKQGEFSWLSIDRENRLPNVGGCFRGLSWPRRFPRLREDRFLRFNKEGRLPEIRGTTTGTFLELRKIK